MLSDKSYIKDSFLTYIFVFLTIPITYLIRIFYSHSLDISDFGLFYSIFSFLSLFYIFVDFGLTQALSYFTPKFKFKNELENIRNSLYFVFFFQVFFSIILIIIIFFFSSFLSNNYFKNENATIALFYFSICFLFINIVNPVKGFLIGLKEVKIVKIVDFIKFLLILINSIIFFMILDGNLIFLYIISWTIANFILVFIYFYYLIKKFDSFFEKLPTFDKKLSQKLLKFSFYLFIGSSISILLTQVDIFMITYFLDTSNVGIYSNALSIMTLLSIITLPFSLYLTPIFSELNEKKDYFQISFLLEKIYLLGLIIILPISFIIFTFRKEIITLLFSDKFIEAASILAFFSFFSFFQVFSTYNISVLNGLGLLKNKNKFMFYILLINILLNYFLISSIGVLGAAISTVFSWFLLFIFSYRLLKSKVNFNFKMKVVIKILVSVLVFIFLLTFLKFTFKFGSLVNSVLSLLISLFIYLFLVFYFKLINFSFIKEFLPNSLQKLIKK